MMLDGTFSNCRDNVPDEIFAGEEFVWHKG